MVNRLLTLSAVLENADKLPWEYELYCAPGESWTTSTICAVLDQDDLDDNDESQFAKENGLIYVLGVSDVKQIVENSRLQKSDSNIDDFLTAFQFYFDNDAFIDFSK